MVDWSAACWLPGNRKGFIRALPGHAVAAGPLIGHRTMPVARQPGSTDSSCFRKRAESTTPDIFQ